MPKALPARPNLDWLKKAAKQELKKLRAANSHAKLSHCQRVLASDYGFRSWRALVAHVGRLEQAKHDGRRVFEAARAGDAATVRRALEAGFDPGSIDDDGRTVHQIAKAYRHEAIELLAREAQSANPHSGAETETIQGIVAAAQSGDVAALRERLDARPDLIDALGGRGFQKVTALHLATLRNQRAAIRLLIERGADLNRRDFPDNATPLHFAAMHGDLDTIGLLVEAGADVEGKGDDYEVGVLGWATCFRQVREDVAAYLLDHGARLNIWTAIALDRADEVRKLIARDTSLLTARGQGLHAALLRRRIRDAVAAGADFVFSGAAPFSTSHRNMERIGRRILLVRSLWTARLDMPAPSVGVYASSLTAE